MIKSESKLAALWEHSAAHLSDVREHKTRPCKICGADSGPFDVVDFAKTCSLDVYPAGLTAIPVYYFRCSRCDFIFTSFFDAFSDEEWRTFVYNSEYYACIDPEYNSSRPIRNCRLVDLFRAGQRSDTIGLDYGGGNGATATRLRQMGYRYETFDPYGSSDVSDASKKNYNFCTAFEVAEHTQDPIGMMEKITALCSPSELLILIGTDLSEPFVTAKIRLGWQYAAPRNGHISLYSEQSMRILADKFSLSYYPAKGKIHLFARGVSSEQLKRTYQIARGRGLARRLIGR